MTTPDSVAKRPAPPLGLSFFALVGLALLGIPRVILHDLHIIEEGSPITWLLAVLPPVIWIAAALWAKVPNPFLTVFVIGAIFGVLLMLTHQLFWVSAFGGTPPDVGGPVGTIVPRIAAVFSGTFTGAIIGVVAGLIAWGLQAMIGRSRRQPVVTEDGPDRS